MSAEEKAARQIAGVKNLAELKRLIQPGTELVATYHNYHPDIVGLVRVVTEVQTNAFYSKIKDLPEHKYSACNHGKGFRSEFEKAGAYIFDGTTIKVLNTRQKDGSVLYEFQVFEPELSMKRNEEEPDMNQKEETAIRKYYAEVGIRLREAGFGAGPPESGVLPVGWQGIPLCRISPGGGVTFKPEVRESEDLAPQLDKVIRMAKITAEYMNVMEDAPPLKARDLDGDYRLLSEYGGTVLAAHPTQFGVHFVTWEWVDNHKSLWQGHYFQDYERAKQDFATRSGLVQADRIFSDEQLTEIYRCVRETLDGDYPITDERQKLLEDACWKIEGSVPNLDERVQLSNQKQTELAEQFDQTME